MDYQEWTRQLRLLRRESGFDFAGVATVNRGRRTLLTWIAASGNRNRNYLKIVLEPGKGIAGGVFHRHKTMIVQNVPLEYGEREIVHYPILLAEDLQSFVAFPLWTHGLVRGVLLLAMRAAGGITKERYDRVSALLAEGMGEMEIRLQSYEEALGGEVRQEYREIPIYELVDVPVRAALREERHRIARDLHDSVIQNLLGVQMQLRTIKYAADRDEILEGLQTADEALSSIQKELREILVSVRPGIIEDLGLRAAFRKHFRFLEESYQIRVKFEENIGDSRFGSDIETVFYRIGQEASANACKYSDAGTILSRLLLQDEILTLEITDDGKGFDPDHLQISGGGMGLPGMHYWAGSIGAFLTVRTAPGMGTSIVLRAAVDSGTEPAEQNEHIEDADHTKTAAD